MKETVPNVENKISIERSYSYRCKKLLLLKEGKIFLVLFYSNLFL
jgi:hypothetical protein